MVRCEWCMCDCVREEDVMFLYQVRKRVVKSAVMVSYGSWYST